MARVLVVGDIHGQYDQLQKTLAACRYAGSDQLIFLGDYINRGPDSRKVVELLLELAASPGNIFIRGNHEQMLLHLLAGNADYLYMWLDYSCGRACLQSYGHRPDSVRFDGEHYYQIGPAGKRRLSGRPATSRFIREIFPESHLRFLQSLKLFHESERYFFSHAGVQKDVALAEQASLTDCFLIWGDQEFFADQRDYGKTLVFGHYHLDAPYLRPGRIGIALEGAVAVLDLTNQLLYNGQGAVGGIEADGAARPE